MRGAFINLLDHCARGVLRARAVPPEIMERDLSHKNATELLVRDARGEIRPATGEEIIVHERRVMIRKIPVLAPANRRIVVTKIGCRSQQFQIRGHHLHRLPQRHGDAAGYGHDGFAVRGSRFAVRDRRLLR
jgi:hypothetical protein